MLAEPYSIYGGGGGISVPLPTANSLPSLRSGLNTPSCRIHPYGSESRVKPYSIYGGGGGIRTHDTV